jgi:biotin synthase
LETCVTLGILKDGQAEQLKAAGLDYYNHNLDTAPEFYGDVVTTHTYQDRLDTLQNVREAGLKVCSGGIVGMGETRRHRAGLIAKLASLDPPPESVPINNLVPIPGTPLAVASRLISSSSCAPSPPPASPCRAATCACLPVGSR